LFRLLDEEPNVYRADLGERRRNLVRLGSGSTIREVSRYLWNHGKSFIALPGYDAQTMGGVFNTGTHGSTFTIGPLAEFILSIDLLRSDATYVRIEPKDGITDPVAFAREHPDVKLIQDDDWFYSNIINMGTMGIVHSYVLVVTECYHLKEVRTATTVDEMKAKLKGGKIYELSGVKGIPAELAKVRPRISDGKDGGFKDHPLPAFHLELYFNPHGTTVIVTSRHPVEVEDDAIFGFEPPGRDLVRTLLMGARFSRPALPTWIQDRYRRALVCIVNKIMHTFPSAIPSLINQALDTLVDKAYIDRSFNVFNLGEGTSRIPALAGTIFVPLENDMYLDALDVILGVAKQFAGRKLYETAPASLRFVRATKALIGCPKDYCAFECVFTASTTYAQEMFEAYFKALREKFGGEVRLHWGQILPDFDPEQIRAMYSQYDLWRGIRDELDPEERFLNEWQAKILPIVGP
jgi:D-arabinono-1,4-lactone oxidase